MEVSPKGRVQRGGIQVTKYKGEPSGSSFLCEKKCKHTLKNSGSVDKYHNKTYNESYFSIFNFQFSTFLCNFVADFDAFTHKGKNDKKTILPLGFDYIHTVQRIILHEG